MTGQVGRILDGREDFDFLIGQWDQRHHMLREALAGCAEWNEFPATLDVRRAMGDLGNVDETVMQAPQGEERALTVRLFEPATRLWRIYWADAETGAMDGPMTGRFTNGVGLFYRHELYRDIPVIRRFRWTSEGPDVCRWIQAFSPDGGATWETNWEVDFTRRAKGRD
ncbi:MAG TPA: hypothetical protein VF808_03065 [Ktedonobacterales bacterium]